MKDLRIGNVVRFVQDNIHPPKSNYHFCIYIDAQEHRFFLINSQAREMYYCTQAILPRHYPFLPYESFISCSRFFTYSNDSQSYKVLGHLRREDLQEVIDKVKTARTFSAKVKEPIIEQLLKALLPHF